MSSRSVRVDGNLSKSPNFVVRLVSHDELLAWQLTHQILENYL